MGHREAGFSVTDSPRLVRVFVFPGINISVHRQGACSVKL
jgi:hypothetical protein